MRIGEALYGLGNEFAEGRDLGRIEKFRVVINRELVGFPEPYLHTWKGHTKAEITRHDSMRGVLRDTDDRLLKISTPGARQLNVAGPQNTGHREFFVGFPQKTIPTDTAHRRPQIFLWVRGDDGGFRVSWGLSYFRNAERLSTRLAMSSALEDDGAADSLLRFVARREDEKAMTLTWRDDSSASAPDLDVTQLEHLRDWANSRYPFVSESVVDSEWLRAVCDEDLRYRVTSLTRRLAQDLLLPALTDAGLTDEPSVFLSYRRADGTGDFARAVADRLQSEGATVFVDRDLESGDRWRNIIADGVERSWIVCCLVGEDYLGRFAGHLAEKLSSLAEQPDWCFIELTRGAVPRADGRSRLELVPVGIDIPRTLQLRRDHPAVIRRIFDGNQIAPFTLPTTPGEHDIENLVAHLANRLKIKEAAGPDGGHH